MTVKIGHENTGELAAIVCYHRRQSGLSRVALAELAGVGKTVVYDIEHGKQTVRFSTLIRVLSVLNIALELSGPLMDAYREDGHEAR